MSRYESIKRRLAGLAAKMEKNVTMIIATTVDGTEVEVTLAEFADRIEELDFKRVSRGGAPEDAGRIIDLILEKDGIDSVVN